MLTLSQGVASAVLLLVVALVIVRPWGLPVAWPAGMGALVVLLLGLLSLSALQTILATTWDAAATLIALFILSETLESNGMFGWAAYHLASFAHGSGWRLYGLLLLLTTGVTALLANDGAILMLTPIFAKLFLTIFPDNRSRLPYLFAAGFFADAMSGLLIPSNLTNIIVADAAHLRFVQESTWLLLPTCAAFATGGAAFALRFRHWLGGRYEVSALGDPGKMIQDRVMFWAGWAAVMGLLLGYLASSQVHVPVSFVAGATALLMLLLVDRRRLRPARQVLRAAPWSILIYALGMFAVITAAYNTGSLGFLAAPLHALGLSTHETAFAIVGIGGLFAGLAAAVNNLPATLLGVLALPASGPVAASALYALILGVDLGPKLTPFGSLATLLWLGILKRQGIVISWRSYVRENWWVTLLVLAAALASLLFVQQLFGG